MKKVFKRYRIIMGIFIFLISSLILINLNFKIKFDRIKVLNQIVFSDDDEFKQARENRFVKLKDDLLSKDIVLDNIFIEDGGEVRFNIHKSMYADQLDDFVKFLNDTVYLNVIEVNITKNNFDYDVNVLAEI